MQVVRIYYTAKVFDICDYNLLLNTVAIYCDISIAIYRNNL